MLLRFCLGESRYGDPYKAPVQERRGDSSVVRCGRRYIFFKQEQGEAVEYGWAPFNHQEVSNVDDGVCLVIVH